MNMASVGIEWVAAHRVYQSCQALRAAKAVPPPSLPASRSRLNDWTKSLRLFFTSATCLPSLSLALLYFPVLSFSASMLTFLLAAGFPLSTITLARTLSTFVEISATVIGPLGIRLMEKRNITGKPPAAVERIGLWGLWWQFGNLVPVSLLLFHLTPAYSLPFFTFLALSRLGLWVYDLSVQTLVQTWVDASVMGEYSGVEMGFISGAELAQWVVTAIWGKPEEFAWVSGAGTAAVGLALGLYMVWLGRRRGHLVHWEKVCCKEGRQ